MTTAPAYNGAHDLILSLFHGPVTAMDALIIIGFAGQALFFGRFFVQWIASERAGRSVVPEAFWYFSLFGGLVLTVYAFLRHDPVFLLGQSAGLFIYIRNIMLVRRAKKMQANVTEASPK